METSHPKQYLRFGNAPQARQGMQHCLPRLVDRTAYEASVQAAQQLDTTRREELPVKN
jgi:hypothetical protein